MSKVIEFPNGSEEIRKQIARQRIDEAVRIYMIDHREGQLQRYEKRRITALISSFFIGATIGAAITWTMFLIY